MPQGKRSSKALRSALEIKPTPIEESLALAEKSIKAIEPLGVRLAGLDMRSDENYEILMDEGRRFRDIERGIEKERNNALRELDSVKKRIKGWFEPMLKVCHELLQLVEEKRLVYEGWLDEKHEEEQVRLREETEKEQKRLDRNAKRRAKKANSRAEEREILRSVPELEVPEALREAPVKVAGVAGVSVAKIWDFEVVVAMAVPETTQLKDGEVVHLWGRHFNREGLMAAREDGQEVPGIRFFQKDSPRYGRL